LRFARCGSDWVRGCHVVVERGTPLAGRYHQPLRLAVLPLPAELEGGRGDDDGPRCPGHLRDHRPVVPQVGQTFASSCVGDHHAQATNGISTRCSSRSTARPTTCDVPLTRAATCLTSCSPPATRRPPPGSRGVAVRSVGPGHRQAGQRWRGAPPADTQCGAPSVQISKRPGRKLPPARPAARTRDVAIPVGRWRWNEVVGLPTAA